MNCDTFTKKHAAVPSSPSASLLNMLLNLWDKRQNSSRNARRSFPELFQRTQISASLSSVTLRHRRFPKYSQKKHANALTTMEEELCAASSVFWGWLADITMHLPKLILLEFWRGGFFRFTSITACWWCLKVLLRSHSTSLIYETDPRSVVIKSKLMHWWLSYYSKVRVFKGSI